MDAVIALTPASGLSTAACAAFGVSRASVHRRRAGLRRPPSVARSRPKPARALSTQQRGGVLDLLRAPQFEPPRDCWRLQLVRRRSHYEQDNKQIFG